MWDHMFFLPFAILFIGGTAALPFAPAATPYWTRSPFQKARPSRRGNDKGFRLNATRSISTPVMPEEDPTLLVEITGFDDLDADDEEVYGK